MARKTGRKDREIIISWLKEDLEYYKENKGGVTEFWTPITQKLINSTKKRIKELEDKL
tara:strand:+ start:1756 stop:1929 length:174 start_codon:yes stop_codon:yes gene_type:complete